LENPKFIFSYLVFEVSCWDHFHQKESPALPSAKAHFPTAPPSSDQGRVQRPAALLRVSQCGSLSVWVSDESPA